MALTAIVTNAGRAALVNASNTGTAPVTIAQVGLTATAVVPGVGITVLPGEYKRVATISGDVVADDTIHLIVRDESADLFTVRSFALYLGDGTLFAIYGQADVILEKSAQAIMLLAIDVQFADVTAAMLTFGDTNFLNPPATTERQGVVELATVAEAQAGIDALRGLTPVAAKAAILGWLLAQDGSGSGLDADLLDGQDGSYYSNIPQRLGYTPANRAGDTFTGNVAISKTGSQELHFSGTGNYKWRAIGNNLAGSGGNFHLQYTTDNFGSSFVSGLMLTTAGIASSQGQGVFWGPNNDGAGSGLDADLLDGQDGSFYTNIPQRLGFTPVQQGGGAGHLVNTVKIGWSGTRLKATVDVSDQGNFVFDTHIADVWRASNDGAGSGLDADLLDGLQASQFLRNYNGTWVSSEEGTPRFHFINAGATYMRVTAAFIWQNSANGNIMSLDESGNGWLNGQVDAVRFLARANGDGQAVRIGDDAWIGDINKPNGFGIRGVQDSRAGYLYFGNAQFPLGCNPDDGTLRYNGAVIWNAGNDGAGSGLDADLVDGWHRDSIRDWNNLLNKPFNWSGQGGQPQWLWGSNDGNAYYVWNPANFSVNYANSAGNADTVDGYHASALLPTGNLEASGYCRLPNGLILQWGTVTCSPDSYGSVTFPIQFPTACFHIHSGVATEVGNGNAQANCPLPYAVTQSGASFWNAAPQATAWWMAVGK